MKEMLKNVREAQLLWEKGNFHEAIQLYINLLQEQPNNIELLLEFSQKCLEMKR